MPSPEHTELRNTDEVCQRLRCSRVTLWRLVRTERFPKPIKIASRPFWPQADVDAHLAALIEARGLA